MILAYILFGIVILAVIAAVISLLLSPLMALFNHAAEKNPQTHEQEYLTGILTLGLTNRNSTGEVMIDAAMGARTNKPAKFFENGNDFFPEKMKIHANVIVIEVKKGIAYVIPNENIPI
jgi:hypothetical protein